MTASWLFLPCYAEVVLTLVNGNRRNTRPASMARLLLRHGITLLPRTPMKHVALPLIWFLLLSCVVALASGLSLNLV
jgi:hypothetical protein